MRTGRLYSKRLTKPKSTVDYESGVEIMSHVTNISTAGLEYDLGVIKHLCRWQGWGFIEGKQTYEWFGYSVGDHPIPEGYTAQDLGKCEHAIKIPGCSYEVGVIRGKNDGWIIMADFWQTGGLDVTLGPKGEKFNQLYHVSQDIMWAENKGYAWEETHGSSETSRKIAIYTEDPSEGW